MVVVRGGYARGDLQALDFPSYYGRNLDALNDCLRDVISHGYGWDADPTGFVLAFLGYDAFALACRGTAQTLFGYYRPALPRSGSVRAQDDLPCAEQ